MVWIISKIAKNGYLAVMVGVSSDYIFRALMYHFRVEKGEWKFIKFNSKRGTVLKSYRKVLTINAPARGYLNITPKVEEAFVKAA